MQIFLSPPLARKGSETVRDDVPGFAERCHAEDILPLFIHFIHLVNLAAPDTNIWESGY